MRKLRDYDESYWGNQTPLGLAAKLGAIIVAIIVVVLVLSFSLGWFNAAKNVVSPNNVKNQYQFAYDYNNALRAIAQNVCIAEKAVQEAPEADKSERQSQLISYETLYSQRAGEYNSALENAFRAKYVAPADVPRRAPTLSEELIAVGC